MFATVLGSFLACDRRHEAGLVLRPRRPRRLPQRGGP